MARNTALNVSVFKSGDMRQTAATSGQYTNKRSGVAIPTASLPAGEYTLIPSTFTPAPGSFVLIFYSSHPIHIAREK
jgi:hypothetical protein